jgi:hypothetical protein
MYGREIGSKLPIMHAKKDKLFSIAFSDGFLTQRPAGSQHGRGMCVWPQGYAVDACMDGFSPDQVRGGPLLWT